MSSTAALFIDTAVLGSMLAGTVDARFSVPVALIVVLRRKCSSR